MSLFTSCYLVSEPGDLEKCSLRFYSLQTSSAQSLQDGLRVLGVWFQHGHHDSVRPHNRTQGVGSLTSPLVAQRRLSGLPSGRSRPSGHCVIHVGPAYSAARHTSRSSARQHAQGKAEVNLVLSNYDSYIYLTSSFRSSFPCSSFFFLRPKTIDHVCALGNAQLAAGHW